MNNVPEYTHNAGKLTSDTHSSAVSGAERRKGLWSRAWTRVTALVVGFAVVMIVANSIASALENPIAALLIGPLLAVLVLWLYRLTVHRVEERPVTELRPRGAAPQVLIGVAGGFLLAAATIGILALLGGYRIIGWGSVSGALTVVGIMCTVAVTEEVLFRGVIFRLVQHRWGTWLALAVSAALFGLVHLINPGATLWGAIAIAIEAGLMLGAAYLVTGSLWLPIGLHLGWNVANGAIFGTVVSGGGTPDGLLLASNPGPDWLTGGDFGPEASIIAVVACSMATAALLFVAHRRGNIVSHTPKPESKPKPKSKPGSSHPDSGMPSSRERAAGGPVRANDVDRGHFDARQVRLHRRWHAAPLWTTLGVYGVALVACFVVNLSVEHTLTWFWIVASAVGLAFSLTTLPMLLTAHRGWLTLTASLVSLGLLLASIQYVADGTFFGVVAASVLFAGFVIWGPLAIRDFAPAGIRRHGAIVSIVADSVGLAVLLWIILSTFGLAHAFFPIAMPLVGWGVTAAVLLTAVVRYLPLRGLYRGAIASVLGAAIALTTEPYVESVLNARPFAFGPVDLTRWSDATINGNVNMLAAMGFLLAAGFLVALSARTRAVVTTGKRRATAPTAQPVPSE